MARSANPKTKPRRRLDAAAARELILNAAESRLVGVGPSGIRLQEVAADAGVSHPTVLHHFGSRELLVKAVITRSLQSINRAIVEAIQASGGDEKQLALMMENLGRTFESCGYARVITWLTLEGHRIDGAEVSLSDVVDAMHALRLSRTKQKRKPPRDDTARMAVLAAMTLVAGPVLGPTLLQNAGLVGDAKAESDFRTWLTRLLIAQLDA